MLIIKLMISQTQYFYFEKSLLLDPNNNETINNLSFSQNMTIDRIETVPVNQVSKFISKFTNLFDYNTWFLISILFEFLSLIVFHYTYSIKTLILKSVTSVLDQYFFFVL